MMRARSRNPLQRVIERAVAATEASLARSGALESASAYAGGSTPVSITETGTTDGGTIYTRHDFMLGVDPLGGRSGELRVQGTEIDYGD